MPGIKLLVCGGRDYSDQSKIFSKLDAVHAKRPICLIIEGGANGADAMARAWATLRAIHVCTIMALWNAHGRAAGPLRNEAMLSLKPDGVLAFSGGRGTASMVSLARAAGIKVVEVR